jgi:small subunit ribosomal protein S16
LATTIRLTRMGKKKRPFYRLVVLDSRKRRDGAYLANLGYYNPFSEPHEVQLHTDEIIAWLRKGASLSETARSLLRAEGVLYRYALESQGVSAEEADRKMAEWRQGSEARRARAASRRRSAPKQAEAAPPVEAEAEKSEPEAAAAAAAESGSTETIDKPAAEGGQETAEPEEG